MCLRTLLHLCVHVGVRLKLYFHIGALACVITQPYFSSVYNFFSKCCTQNAKLQQGQKDTVITTDKEKKEKSLVRKISLFVRLTMQV